MSTAASRRPVGPQESTDKAAEAALDKSVDYSDEVTAEQMVELERAFAHLDMGNWKVKAGPVW
jgi:hypothetical protein